MCWLSSTFYDLKRKSGVRKKGGGVNDYAQNETDSLFIYQAALLCKYEI